MGLGKEARPGVGLSACNFGLIGKFSLSTIHSRFNSASSHLNRRTGGRCRGQGEGRQGARSTCYRNNRQWEIEEDVERPRETRKGRDGRRETDGGETVKQTEGNGERERDGQRDTRRYRHEEKVGETETGRGRNRLLGH